MRTLFTIAALIAISLALPSSAYAQSTITVINEDGTKSTIDIGPSPNLPPVEKSTKPKAVTAAPETPAVKPVTKAEPEKPEAKKADAKKAEFKKPAPKPAPVKKEAAKEKAKTPAKKAPAKAASKTAAKTPAKPQPKPANDPSKKPDAKRGTNTAPTAETSAAAAPAGETGSNLGPAMTPEDAIRLTLDAAPPARKVNAYPVNYKGLHAYEVVYTTEDGDQAIYIDRDTGKIVK